MKYTFFSFYSGDPNVAICQIVRMAWGGDNSNGSVECFVVVHRNNHLIFDGHILTSGTDLGQYEGFL